MQTVELNLLYIYGLGFSGSSRSYSVVDSPQKGASDSKPDADNSVLDKEIAALRREFEAAKQSFLKIPDALKEMPKMNPKGSFIAYFIVSLVNAMNACIVLFVNIDLFFFFFVGLFYILLLSNKLCLESI